VTAILIFVVAMAIIAGLVWVMVRMERSHRQLIERRREAWRAGGSVGLEPGRCGGGGSGGVGGGGFSPPGG
jgi:hypothetical protein